MEAANFLNVSGKVLRYYLDSNKPLQGYFVFSWPLSKEEIKNLKGNTITNLYTKPVKVWAYNAKSLELVNGSAFPLSPFPSLAFPSGFAGGPMRVEKGNEGGKG